MAEDGVTELDQNQRGELWVRGQNIMKGYWRNPEATKETKTEDGWLKTGDIAFVDSEGRFHVVDRKKVYIYLHWRKMPMLMLYTGAHQSERQPGSSGRVRGHSTRTPSSCRCGRYRRSNVCY